MNSVIVMLNQPFATFLVAAGFQTRTQDNYSQKSTPSWMDEPSKITKDCTVQPDLNLMMEQEQDWNKTPLKRNGKEQSVCSIRAACHVFVIINIFGTVPCSIQLHTWKQKESMANMYFFLKNFNTTIAWHSYVAVFRVQKKDSIFIESDLSINPVLSCSMVFTFILENCKELRFSFPLSFTCILLSQLFYTSK